MSRHRPSLLLIDAGNTRSKFALATTCSQLGKLPDCAHFVAALNSESLPWDEMRGWIVRGDVVPTGAVTGSNPQQIERITRDWPSDWPTPRVMIDRRELPITVDVDYPERVGMDRLLNAVAANVLRRENEPAIVIDVGTATTVDAISREGAFLGGAIIAGPELTARALHEYTAVLPLVSLEELGSREPPVIGRNTQEAIASGLYWGHWQSVWSYCVRMMEPLGVTHAPQTFLTGGAAHLFRQRLSPAHQYLPHLTLQGLAISALGSDAQPTELGGH